MMIILSILISTAPCDVQVNIQQWADHELILRDRAHFNYVEFPQQAWEHGYEVAEEHGSTTLRNQLNWFLLTYAEFMNAHDNVDVDELHDAVLAILQTESRLRCN